MFQNFYKHLIANAKEKKADLIMIVSQQTSEDIFYWGYDDKDLKAILEESDIPVLCVPADTQVTGTILGY